VEDKRNKSIEFELSPEHEQALRTIAGGRQVRLSGRVVQGSLRVDFVACNAPFLACNAPFTTESAQATED
jgi:hypothetical protein